MFRDPALPCLPGVRTSFYNATDFEPSHSWSRSEVLIGRSYTFIARTVRIFRLAVREGTGHVESVMGSLDHQFDLVGCWSPDV